MHDSTWHSTAQHSTAATQHGGQVLVHKTLVSSAATAVIARYSL